MSYTTWSLAWVGLAEAEAVKSPSVAVNEPVITVPLASVQQGGEGMLLRVRVTNTAAVNTAAVNTAVVNTAAANPAAAGVDTYDYYNGHAAKVVSAYLQRIEVRGTAAADAPRKSLFAMAKVRPVYASSTRWPIYPTHHSQCTTRNAPLPMHHSQCTTPNASLFRCVLDLQHRLSWSYTPPLTLAAVRFARFKTAMRTRTRRGQHGRESTGL